MFGQFIFYFILRNLLFNTPYKLRTMQNKVREAFEKLGLIKELEKTIDYIAFASFEVKNTDKSI